MMGTDFFHHLGFDFAILIRVDQGEYGSHALLFWFFRVSLCMSDIAGALT